MFYHIKNLQSTKTLIDVIRNDYGFITLRIYKVLKQIYKSDFLDLVLSH